MLDVPLPHLGIKKRILQRGIRTSGRNYSKLRRFCKLSVLVEKLGYRNSP